MPRPLLEKQKMRPSNITYIKIAPHKTECLRLGYAEDNSCLEEMGLQNIGPGRIIRYLGCPVGLGITPHQCFLWLSDRIKAKVQSRGHLSLAGRLVVLYALLIRSLGASSHGSRCALPGRREGGVSPT